MKETTMRGQSAFTLIEVFVVIVVLVVLAVLIMPNLMPGVRKPSRAYCVECRNNLHQIGIAYRIWSGDNGDLFPSERSVAKGGWEDLLTNANQGTNCWTNYALMASDLGGNPKVLLCPADERSAAKDFGRDFNDNTHLSYFVGVDADEYHPLKILGGDRNLGPGSEPDPDYGFSPKDGNGNDVAVPISGRVSWSLKMHSVGPSGAKDIMLGDGSVQRVSKSSINQYLTNAEPSMNWPAGHVPSLRSIRLIFP
jgi:type II secretory pathway pseudopilin PulG